MLMLMLNSFSKISYCDGRRRGLRFWVSVISTASLRLWRTTRAPRRVKGTGAHMSSHGFVTVAAVPAAPDWESAPAGRDGSLPGLVAGRPPRRRLDRGKLEQRMREVNVDHDIGKQPSAAHRVHRSGFDWVRGSSDHPVGVA